MSFGNKKSNFAKGTTTSRRAMSFDSKQIINLWGEPVTGKTDGIVALVQAGYNVDYINFDDNVRPFSRLNEEELGRVNNIRVKDTLTKFNIANFPELLRSEPALQICTDHGNIACPTCKKGGEFLIYNPSKSTADVTVIDSVSAYLDSATIKTKQDSLTSKTTFNEFGAQGLHVDTFHHFIKGINTHVIVICHAIQLANTLKDNYTDDYHPLLGTRPKSKRSMNIYSAVIRSIEGKDTYQVARTKSFFTTLRDSELETALKDKPRAEILKALLGKPLNSAQIENESADGVAT